MPARPRLVRHRLGWLWHLAVVLSVVSQLAGGLLPLLEGREGRGAGAHVEALGNTPHYVHDDSTCGACHVRSMHGRVAVAPRDDAADQIRSDAPALAASGAPLADQAFSNRTRAPPVVI